MPNAGAIESTITELAMLEIEFSGVQSRREAAFMGHWNKKYDPESLKEASQSASTPADVDVLDALHRRLDAVCEVYLETDNDGRLKLRAELAKRNTLLNALHEHVAWCSKRLKEPSGQQYLRTGLAAIALHDNQLDFRETYVALAMLYVEAVKAGIQPSLDLYKIGSLASEVSRTRWPEDSTRNFLQRFEESAYFRDYVHPKINTQ